MKIKKVISDTEIICYVLALLIYIFISCILLKYSYCTLLDLSNGLIAFAITGVLIYVFKLIFINKKFELYDLLIFLLFVFGVIATIYSIKINVSLFGFGGRYEGLFQLTLYYVLFLLCKSINNRKYKIILINFIIGWGVIQAIYGILQFFDIDTLCGIEIIRNRYYSTGFEVNSNFFSSIMMICISLSIGLYFVNENKIVSLITLISSTILFLGLLCSGAMSGAISFFFLVIFLIILFCILKVNVKLILAKFSILLLLFFACYKIFSTYDKGYYLTQIQTSTHEMNEILKGNAEEKFGTGRIHIWKETLKIVPKNIWNGVGIDNFFYAFGDIPLIDITNQLAVDKAHNEYLQKLITEGIFSILTYLGLLILIFINSIKKILKNRLQKDWMLIILFLSFISYCIQAFFNISVISVAPIFYIIMGLLCSMLKRSSYEKIKNEKI